MSRNNYENVNGINTIYGPVSSDSTYGTKVAETNSTPRIEIEFEGTDLPIAFGAGDVATKDQWATIPAGSKIVSAEVFVETAFAGGTNITVGLANKETGAAIDADGLVAATVTANLTQNAVITGAGALIGLSSGANPAVVTVSQSGTYTSGKAKLLVSYRPQGADI